MTSSPTETPLNETTITGGPALKMSAGQRLLMVAAGFTPFLNLVVIVTLAILPATARWPRWTWFLAPAWLLVIPPLVVRVILAIRPLPKTDIAVGSAPFLIWWFASQWQVIFNRLPWIEEIIRLAPGLYSVWLRLWGARIGKFVYWTPGLQILDRPLLDIGDRVVFGAGVKISPHIIMPNRDGQIALLVAPVRIGADALVGAYSILLAGSWIGSGEVSPGKRILAPFAGWVGGRRVDATDESKLEH
jgi:hypothetical protein